MSYRNYANTNGWLVNANGTGDFISLSAAYAANPPAGTLISVAPGTYSDSGSILPGISVTALGGDQANSVVFTGTWTMTAAGTAQISGIKFIGSSVYSIVFSGSNLSNLILNNVFIVSATNNAISCTNTNASSSLDINYLPQT